MSGEIGHLLLILAGVAAFVQAIAGLRARPLPALVHTAARWQAVGTLGALVALGWAFVHHDFSLRYVAQHGHSQLPLPYRIAAVWGGHEGSMLLWAGVLAAWGLAALRSLMPRDADYAARVGGMLALVGGAMDAFVLFTSNPFARLLPAAAEGQSLNPLLQDPGLVLHPPLLYLGYVGTAVPFAMTLAALRAPAPADWLRWSRPATAVALAFLSLGIALGSWWAYYELGWGGWWFWDPVENASLMPWLAMAALLHLQAAREARSVFPEACAGLAIGAFVLSLLGTFLVRSGVLTSVHAFASDPRRGSFMLALVAATLLGSLMLYARHGARLRPAREAGALPATSREFALAAGALLLVVACACVLLGTLYPLAMDALHLGKLSVGAPYFDAVMGPLLLPALALLVPALWLRWGRSTTWTSAPRALWLGAAFWAAGGAAALAALWLHYRSLHLGVVLTLLLAWGVGFSTLAWAVRHGRATGLRAFGRGHAGKVLAHLGVAAFAVGVAMVQGHGVERDVRFAPGDRHRLADCELQLHAVQPQRGANYEALVGRFTLQCPGREAQTLQAEKRQYVGSGMPMTESAIAWGLTRDLYVALGEPLEASPTTGAWSVRVQVKPFMRWVWLGVVAMALGCALAASSRLRLRARNPALRPQAVATAAQPVPAPPAPEWKPARPIA